MDLNNPNNMQNFFDNQNFLENIATNFSNNDFINTSSSTPEFASSPIPPPQPSSSSRRVRSRKNANASSSSSDLQQKSKSFEM